MIGQTVSHYRILSKLGAGGMGEVYLAEDQTLGRRVALKLLLPAVARERDRIDRFILEARAASVMNHPNIAHIHELGDTGDVPFIAMEYVEGRLLDALIAEGPLDPFQALDIVRQVTNALAEAHAKGITHRDIKPGNVMVTPRGLVKVLDFGLAKLLPYALAQPTAGPNTPTMAGTNPGLVLGTVHYMSPEQALGRDTDGRTDLFSLGVVFYQLVTGRLPFEGDSGTATIDAILHHDPPLPSTLRPEIPPAFDRVIARALAKARDERYASAHEMAADLDALERGVEPAAAPVRRPAGRSFAWRLAAATTLVLLLGATAWHLSRRPPPIAGVTTPLTSLPGPEMLPAFSPDGAIVAYTWTGPGQNNADIFLQAVNGGDPVRLTTSPARDSNPVFSPDGMLVAFARNSTQLMVVPSGGGTEREITEIADARFTFTPDGRSVAVGGPSNPGGRGIGIQVVPLDGGAARTITHPPPGSSDLNPRFSPDGTLLAFERVPVTNVSDIYVVAAAGGEPTRLTFDDRGLDGLAWTGDGQFVVFASGRSGPPRLWKVSRNGGPPLLIGEAPPGSTNPAVDPVNDRLAFTVQAIDTNIWELRLDEHGAPAGGMSPLIASTLLDGSPDFSEDGNFLAFASNRTGRDQIWISAPDGTSARSVTNVSESFITSVGSPRWSPDGMRLAFDARVRGNADIYLINRAGGAWRRLTTNPSSDVIPTWSRDGKWIYFTSRRTGRPEVWRVPPDGGTETRVTLDGGFAAQESLDGTQLHYSRVRELAPLFTRPKAGGAERPLLIDVSGTAHHVFHFACWRQTSKGIVFIEELPATETAPRRHAIQRLRPDRVLETLGVMPKFASLGAGGLAVSPDERRILFTVLDSDSSDIYLLQPFR